MRVRLNKAYLIIGLAAIFVVASMLSGPLLRRRAREKAGQAATPVNPVAAPQAQPEGTAPPQRDSKAASQTESLKASP